MQAPEIPVTKCKGNNARYPRFCRLFLGILTTPRPLCIYISLHPIGWELTLVLSRTLWSDLLPIYGIMKSMIYVLWWRSYSSMHPSVCMNDSKANLTCISIICSPDSEMTSPINGKLARTVKIYALKVIPKFPPILRFRYLVTINPYTNYIE